MINESLNIKYFILGSQYEYECFHQVCDQFTGNLTDFEFYDHKNGECTICQDRCDQDATCSAVECGTVHCLGWKNGKCNNVKEMLIATRSDLRTCAKKKKSSVGNSKLYPERKLTYHI